MVGISKGCSGSSVGSSVGSTAGGSNVGASVGCGVVHETATKHIAMKATKVIMDFAIARVRVRVMVRVCYNVLQCVKCINVLQ